MLEPEVAVSVPNALTSRDLADAAEQGNGLARQILDRGVRTLG